MNTALEGIEREWKEDVLRFARSVIEGEGEG
jgi:hypothetical protein